MEKHFTDVELVRALAGSHPLPFFLDQSPVRSNAIAETLTSQSCVTNYIIFLGLVSCKVEYVDHSSEKC